MTDNEPTVRYWRHPDTDASTWAAADDTISGYYRDLGWVEVHVLTDAELAAHTTAARADALREARDAWAADPDAVGDSFADARNWLLDRADEIARTPDPNGDNT